jgi:hypothetical protein
MSVAPTKHLRSCANERQERKLSVCPCGLDVEAQIDLPLRTIVIDAGKTFQAGAVEWFPKYVEMLRICYDIKTNFMTVDLDCGK